MINGLLIYHVFIVVNISEVSLIAKKPKPPIKVSFLIQGVEYDEPPAWIKKHIADVMAGKK